MSSVVLQTTERNRTRVTEAPCDTAVRDRGAAVVSLHTEATVAPHSELPMSHHPLPSAHCVPLQCKVLVEKALWELQMERAVDQQCKEVFQPLALALDKFLHFSVYQCIKSNFYCEHQNLVPNGQHVTLGWSTYYMYTPSSILSKCAHITQDLDYG